MEMLMEALERRFRRRDCPFIKDCTVEVTRDYFTRICSTPAYVNCHHYARRVGELRTPLGWLQKIAVDQAKMMERDIEAR